MYGANPGGHFSNFIFLVTFPNAGIFRDLVTEPTPIISPNYGANTVIRRSNCDIVFVSTSMLKNSLFGKNVSCNWCHE